MMKSQDLFRVRTHILAALGATVMIAVSGTAFAQARPPLKIGGCLSVTGPAHIAGSSQLKTLELYIDRINAGGGVDGRKIEFRNYDDESDAARANTQVTRLIENDKVHAIIGCSLTGPTLSVIPLVERAGIPMISLGAGTAIVEPVKKFVFKAVQTEVTVISRLYSHMLSRGFKNIGIISISTAFGQSCLASAEKLAPVMGIKILRSESHNPKDADMTAQLTKLRQEPGVQAILNCSYGDPAVVLTKNYKQLGITIPHYGNHGLASSEFLALTGGAAEGMILANVPLLVWDQLAANDPQRPVLAEYVESYRAKYKEDPTFFGGTALDALTAIQKAVQRSRSIEPGKIRDALEKGNDFIGVTGQFKMTESDHVGLAPSSLRVLRVKNNAWEMLQ